MGKVDWGEIGLLNGLSETDSIYMSKIFDSIYENPNIAKSESSTLIYPIARRVFGLLQKENLDPLLIDIDKLEILIEFQNYSKRNISIYTSMASRMDVEAELVYRFSEEYAKNLINQHKNL